MDAQTKRTDGLDYSNKQALRPIHARGFAPGACSRLILHVSGTHEGAFSSSLNWSRELAPKYLLITC